MKRKQTPSLRVIALVSLIAIILVLGGCAQADTQESGSASLEGSDVVSAEGDTESGSGANGEEGTSDQDASEDEASANENASDEVDESYDLILNTNAADEVDDSYDGTFEDVEDAGEEPDAGEGL